MISILAREIDFKYFLHLKIYFYGINRLKNSNLITYNSNLFRIVQPNINQNDKLDFSKLEINYKKLMELSFKNKEDLLNTSENLIIFWPEY